MSTAAFSKTSQGRSAHPVAHCLPEKAVLSHLLDQHPRRLTLDGLMREMDGAFDDGAITRAVDNLAAARFLRRDGAMLIPAPAVLNFDQGPAAAPEL
jgi:hypothetical protein